MAKTSVDSSRLLEKSKTILPRLRGTRASRAVLRQLLKRVSYGELRLSEESQPIEIFGGHKPGPKASVTIHHPNAWQSIALEGSAGLGRGYMEGWWSSPDPVQVISFLNLNIRSFDGPRNTLAKFTTPVKGRRLSSLWGSVKDEDKDNIGSHYDIGNEFFKTFLDDTMTYSAGIFSEEDDSMEQASLNKYDRLIEKTQITSDSHVLEIGTGWGGFAKRAATTKGCKVTTTTISDEQFELAGMLFSDSGLGDSVNLLKSDWRDLTGLFDQIVSIEMIEAVNWRDYPEFFGKLSSSCKPGAKIGLQAICVPDSNYERIKQTKDFIRTFIFPGGFLPSVEEIGRHSTSNGLEVVEVYDLTDGYVKTLQIWREAFEANAEQVKLLGLDDKFRRLWSFYLMYCEAAFAQRSCTVNQIVLQKAKG